MLTATSTREDRAVLSATWAGAATENAGGAGSMSPGKPVSLNLNIRGMGLSATLDINERFQVLRASGRTVYNMGLGQSPFPVPDPVVEALRLAAPEKDYLPVKGLSALREAVAGFHRKHEQIEAQPEGVIIGPGSKELMFLVQLAFYGEIIVVPPCWVSYLPQARIIGRRVSMVETTFESGWKVGAEQLLRAMSVVNDDYRPRLLVLNYPANPTGQTYTPAELKDLAEVARKYQIIVLSDEIYGQLHHQGQHCSIARFYPEGTIVSSGLSKWCGAGGWRLGTFTFPPDLYWLLNAMAAVASETYTSVSAPIQHAAVRAFRGSIEIERYLCHARRILSQLGAESAQMLIEAGLRVHQPRGAFYMFADFSPDREVLARRGVRDGATLTQRLLDDVGVAALPGVSFVQSRADLTARLAYVDFDGARALAASEQIPLHEPLPADFTRTYCERVLIGIERICDWVHNDQP